MNEVLFECVRKDGRQADDFRIIEICFNDEVKSESRGYATLHQGFTCVKAAVVVHECRIYSEVRHNAAIVVCKYHKSPSADFNGNRRNTKRDLKSIVHADYIKKVMQDNIVVKDYGESQIDILIDVIESDGSELAVAINAVTLALIDAGIKMTDFIVACTLGLHDQSVLLDLDRSEENRQFPTMLMVRSHFSRRSRINSSYTPDPNQRETFYKDAENACADLAQVLMAACKQNAVVRLVNLRTVLGQNIE